MLQGWGVSMEGLEMSGIGMHDWFPKKQEKTVKKIQPKKGGGIWMGKPSKLENPPPQSLGLVDKIPASGVGYFPMSCGVTEVPKAPSKQNRMLAFLLIDH